MEKTVGENLAEHRFRQTFGQNFGVIPFLPKLIRLVQLYAVTGLMLTKVFPLSDGTYCPSIKCRQSIVFFSIDVCMVVPPNPIVIEPSSCLLPRLACGCGWKRSLLPEDSRRRRFLVRKNVLPNPRFLPVPVRSENPSPPSLQDEGWSVPG